MVKYLSRPCLFLIFLSLVSCGDKTKSIQFGKTTVANLIQVKGEPLKEEVIPTFAGKVLHFKQDEKFQVKGDVVVVGFKGPTGDERKLIFWKHRFKECETKIRKLQQNEMELACESQGISVVYSEGSEFVSRVVEYEVK